MWIPVWLPNPNSPRQVEYFCAPKQQLCCQEHGSLTNGMFWFDFRSEQPKLGTGWAQEWRIHIELNWIAHINTEVFAGICSCTVAPSITGLTGHWFRAAKKQIPQIPCCQNDMVQFPWSLENDFLQLRHNTWESKTFCDWS